MDMLHQILQVFVNGFDTFLGGLMAIICAVIGAKLSSRASDTREKISRLDNAYDNFFHAYYHYVARTITGTVAEDDFALLSTAAERLRRICSEESASLIEPIATALYDKKEPRMDMKHICQLRESSKKDMEDTKRKKRRSKVKKKSSNG